jgi:hypothetical protein
MRLRWRCQLRFMRFTHVILLMIALEQPRARVVRQKNFRASQMPIRGAEKLLRQINKKRCRVARASLRICNYFLQKTRRKKPQRKLEKKLFKIKQLEKYGAGLDFDN